MSDINEALLEQAFNLPEEEVAKHPAPPVTRYAVVVQSKNSNLLRKMASYLRDIRSSFKVLDNIAYCVVRTEEQSALFSREISRAMDFYDKELLKSLGHDWIDIFPGMSLNDNIMVSTRRHIPANAAEVATLFEQAALSYQVHLETDKNFKECKQKALAASDAMSLTDHRKSWVEYLDQAVSGWPGGTSAPILEHAQFTFMNSMRGLRFFSEKAAWKEQMFIGLREEAICEIKSERPNRDHLRILSGHVNEERSKVHTRFHNIVSNIFEHNISLTLTANPGWEDAIYNGIDFSFLRQMGSSVPLTMRMGVNYQSEGQPLIKEIISGYFANLIILLETKQEIDLIHQLRQFSSNMGELSLSDAMPEIIRRAVSDRMEKELGAVTAASLGQ